MHDVEFLIYFQVIPFDNVALRRAPQLSKKMNDVMYERLGGSGADTTAKLSRDDEENPTPTRI